MGLVLRSDGSCENCYVFNVHARGSFLAYKRVRGRAILLQGQVGLKGFGGTAPRHRV